MVSSLLFYSFRQQGVRRLVLKEKGQPARPGGKQAAGGEGRKVWGG